MKKKVREQIAKLAKQLSEEEKSFNTSNIKGLVGELYEKLSVLEYLENQIESSAEDTLPTSLDSKSFREENWFKEPEPVPQPEHQDDLIEPLMEKIKDIVAQMPEESERIDEMLDGMLPKFTEDASLKHDTKDNGSKHTQNDLEEFASNYQQMPEFERKTLDLFPPSTQGEKASKTMTESRAKSLNDSINRGLNVGLNDRLAFVKHLFDGHAEDYTRVLSQINTMDNFEEAQNFIQEKVKPDYNYWLNKEEYSERFMNIVEKSFN
ncbi:MAG: hypothetical protein CL526_05760 [Aequorivita sp.]|nr:hypothetical protein [Aequorivita sp.]|tara:strand:- start:27586 stop:28380 length:795 start_codon:yes stop_codon:yes gene_type:complete